MVLGPCLHGSKPQPFQLRQLARKNSRFGTDRGGGANQLRVSQVRLDRSAGRDGTRQSVHAGFADNVDEQIIADHAHDGPQ